MTVLSNDSEPLFGPPPGTLPAPPGSQQVPQPTYLQELPHYMLYGFELDPALFGPGGLEVQRADGKVVTYPRPCTAADAVNAFQLPGQGVGTRRAGPDRADNDATICSNFGEAIASKEMFDKLREELHLVREPRWIDTIMWETPELRARLRRGARRRHPWPWILSLSLRRHTAGPAQTRPL
ncbi:hypothetical protein B0H15DRAFT_926963 [Mycena belliarum]|uniref:Uncharacterized protein n=1 Tax=Mycena belliarum TaxID=1033014 RepID=A0AAD6UG70_9AGAR|nr:hypothetical protein B0H15DRAFT_926963 [Mycena belliae]